MELKALWKAGAAISLSLLFANPGVAQEKLTPVRILEYPGSINQLVTWVQEEKGFCEKEGLKCEPIALQSGPLAQQAAAAGSIDLIHSTLDVMFQAVARGNDLMILGTLTPTNVFMLAERSAIVQKNLSYPQNVAALKGHRIGVSARGSGTELFARALLRGAGLSVSDVTIIGVGAPPTAFPALISNRIDALLLWDPIPALCEATKKCEITVDMRKGQGPKDISALGGNGNDVWQARREYVEKHPKAIDAFLRAQAAATKWMQDPKNFDEVYKIAEKHINIDIDVPDKGQLMKNIVKTGIGMAGNHFDKRAVTAFNNFLIANGAIKEPINADKVVYKNAP